MGWRGVLAAILERLPIGLACVFGISRGGRLLFICACVLSAFTLSKRPVCLVNSFQQITVHTGCVFLHSFYLLSNALVWLCVAMWVRRPHEIDR